MPTFEHWLQIGIIVWFAISVTDKGASLKSCAAELGFIGLILFVVIGILIWPYSLYSYVTYLIGKRKQN
jgi:hypothetical protein